LLRKAGGSLGRVLGIKVARHHSLNRQPLSELFEVREFDPRRIRILFQVEFDGIAEPA
jgi:hypothetical protein